VIVPDSLLLAVNLVLELQESELHDEDSNGSLRVCTKITLILVQSLLLKLLGFVKNLLNFLSLLEFDPTE